MQNNNDKRRSIGGKCSIPLIMPGFIISLIIFRVFRVFFFHGLKLSTFFWSRERSLVFLTTHAGLHVRKVDVIENMFFENFDPLVEIIRYNEASDADYT